MVVKYALAPCDRMATVMPCKSIFANCVTLGVYSVTLLMRSRVLRHTFTLNKMEVMLISKLMHLSMYSPTPFLLGLCGAIEGI